MSSSSKEIQEIVTMLKTIQKEDGSLVIGPCASRALIGWLGAVSDSMKALEELKEVAIGGTGGSNSSTRPLPLPPSSEGFQRF